MRRTVGPEMGVKASGGVRTLEDLKKMVGGGSYPRGRQRQRQDRRGHGGLVLRSAWPTPRKAGEAFRERAELLDFLLEVSRVTSETLDLDKLSGERGAIIEEVVVPYDLFAILLYSERNQGLRIRYSIGHREEIVRSLVIGLGEGVVGAAAHSREPVLVEDVRSDPRYLVALDAVQSELAVPMMARGKLVGVIDVQSTRAARVHDQDRAHHAPDRLARRGVDRKRPPLPPRASAEPNFPHAGAALAGVQLDSGSG